jgi:hypothetical protein
MPYLMTYRDSATMRSQEMTYESLARDYYWRRAGDDLVLEESKTPTPWAWRRFDVFRDEPALFKTFADTAPDADGVLAFAKKYGTIKDKLPLSEWKKEINLMRGLVVFWDAAKNGDSEALKPFILNQDERGIFWHLPEPYAPKPESQLGYLDDVRSPIDQPYPPRSPGDLPRQAFPYLAERINTGLIGNTAAGVLWDWGVGRCHVTTAPTSLLGAMYVQFALALEGDKEFRQCAGCSGWLAVKRKNNPKPALYCSRSCRNRAHQARKEKARAMFAEGKGHKEIAAELNARVATIKQWVKKRKES